MRDEFVYNERLGIHVPELIIEWELYGLADREQILDQWEQIRGRIPERIIKIEAILLIKQAQLSLEENFPLSCQINTEIADWASVINDLHLWYRSNQDIYSPVHQ